MQIKQFIGLSILLLLGNISAYCQTETNLTAEEIEAYSQQSRQMVSYLEGTLNFLGNPDEVASEKDIIINESYAKMFVDEDVQIEDDLDEKSDNAKPKSFCGCFKKKKKEELLPDGESDDQKDSGSDPSIKKSATAAEPVLSEGSQNPWDNAPNSQCYCMTDETRKLKP